MTNTLWLRPASLAVAVSLLGAAPLGAQRTTRARCDRIATTSISFGRTGGNIRPSGVRILANGVVRDIGDTSEPPRAVAKVPAAEARRIAGACLDEASRGSRLADTGRGEGRRRRPGRRRSHAGASTGGRSAASFAARSRCRPPSSSNFAAVAWSPAWWFCAAITAQ